MRFYVKMWQHINGLPLLRDTHVVLDILSSCIVRRFSYLTQAIYPSFFVLFLLANFDKIVIQICGNMH
jgi:hypothetical protein